MNKNLQRHIRSILNLIQNTIIPKTNSLTHSLTRTNNLLNNLLNEETILVSFLILLVFYWQLFASCCLLLKFLYPVSIDTTSLWMSSISVIEYPNRYACFVKLTEKANEGVIYHFQLTESYFHPAAKWTGRHFACSKLSVRLRPVCGWMC